MELIIIIIFWILMGLQAIAPYITAGVFSNLSFGWRAAAVLLFILLGPLIAISNVVNVILVYFTGGDDDEVP